MGGENSSENKEAIENLKKYQAQNEQHGAASQHMMRSAYSNQSLNSDAGNMYRRNPWELRQEFEKKNAQVVNQPAM